jgi:myxalamid-type polyketide synthase MxaB
LKPLPCTVFGVQEAVTAFRTMQGARHIGKIVLVPPAGVRDEAGALAMRSDATYLITGGLGGLGLAVAQGLAERGARHLLLLGRRLPEAGAAAQLDALAQTGVSIAVVQADVADLAQLRAALRQVDLQHPLRGVVHCAGVLDDASLLQQTPARFAKVLAPKVQGAWHLHQLLQHEPLDFFVLFSSAASLLGSRGQANYAAANAFLDDLAHHRRARGLPALSINWGAWSEVGMAARLAQAHRAEMAAHGVRTISPAQGVAALAHLLGCGAAQVGVLPLDWAALQAADDAALHLPLLSNFVAEAPARAQGSARLADPLQLTRTRLNAASPEQQSELLRTYLVQQVAHVLHVPVQELNADDPLTYMGLDSLMAVELRNRINTDLQYAVPLSQLLEGLSVTDLHRLLLDELGAGAATGVLVTPAEVELDPAAVLSELDAMSEKEVDRLLRQLLAEEGLQP